MTIRRKCFLCTLGRLPSDRLLGLTTLGNPEDLKSRWVPPTRSHVTSSQMNQMLTLGVLDVESAKRSPVFVCRLSVYETLNR